MSLKINQIKSFFSFRNILLPIILGLLATGYLLFHNLSKEVFVKLDNQKGSYVWKDLNQDQWENENEFFPSKNGEYNKASISELLGKINWGLSSFVFIALAFLTMFIRDFAYMLRLRILSDQQLSLKSTFHSIMLWETASAITPSVVGGSSIAMFILNKEGISLGKSTAIVMATALLDELFFVVFVPIILLIVGINNLFPDYMSFTFLGQSINVFKLFTIGYSCILAFILFVSWGLFFKPNQLKKVLFLIFSISVLKKWRKKAVGTGNEIVLASTEFKLKNKWYWLKSFGATTLSWISRYFTANFIILAFVSVNDHFLIIARQLVMWVILLISPTPGGSGVAELLFSSFLKDSSILHLSIIAAIIWRLISYYPYLFIGAYIFPTWLKKVQNNKLKV